MTHEQMMEKAWSFINELGITEDCEKKAENDDLYLVENTHTVRDAYYSDLENEISEENEDLPAFFKRHGIKWE